MSHLLVRDCWLTWHSCLAGTNQAFDLEQGRKSVRGLQTAESQHFARLEGSIGGGSTIYKQKL
jgi:hypothetical protein